MSPHTAGRPDPGPGIAPEDIPLPAMAGHLARELTDERRTAFARWLGLPDGCAGHLPGLIGWSDALKKWTSHETDGHGNVVGIIFWEDHVRGRLWPGSRLGIQPTRDWASTPGPLFLTVGPFEALALASVGLAAVAWEWVCPGVAASDLAVLLGDLDPARPVVVVGTNHDHAIEAAQELAAELLDHLGRPVRWTLSPSQYATLRHWVGEELAGEPEAAGEQVGRAVCQRLMEDAVDADPNPVVVPASPGSPISGRPARFPTPIPMSQLAAAGTDGFDWIWQGILARDNITLFSALPKCGKTTLLAHLLAALPRGGSFLGRALAPGRAVVISEEPESVWAARRDALGLTDAIRVIPRGRLARPTYEEWEAFLAHLRDSFDRSPADLVVFDSLAMFWPVRDENNATEVMRAMAPLHRLCRGRAVELIHHIRKSDGRDGTATRGSGALGGFVDFILEMRRGPPTPDGRRCRRILSGYGRSDRFPPEWAIELVPGDPAHYECCAAEDGEGDPDDVGPLAKVIAGLLPAVGPGLSRDEIWAALPDGLRRNRKKFDAVMEAGVPRWWQKGKRAGQGGGYAYWLAADGGSSEVSPP